VRDNLFVFFYLRIKSIEHGLRLRFKNKITLAIFLYFYKLLFNLQCMYVTMFVRVDSCRFNLTNFPESDQVEILYNYVSRMTTWSDDGDGRWP
jgi:hypothetical protein